MVPFKRISEYFSLSAKSIDSFISLKGTLFKGYFWKVTLQKEQLFKQPLEIKISAELSESPIDRPKSFSSNWLKSFSEINFNNKFGWFWGTIKFILF